MAAFISYLKKEKGQALVETALVFAFILIPLLFGIIQFGIIFNGQMTVISAAREGVRMAVVGKKNDEVNELIINYVNNRPESLFLNPIDDSNIIIVPADDGERTEGGNVTVQVTVDAQVIVPLLNYVVGDVISLSSSATMRVEQLPSQ